MDKEVCKKLNELIDCNKGIALASQVLMTISKDEVERARLESEFKYEVDTQSKVVHAKREGLREGRREIAKKALSKGSTPEFVADITGLSPDEIRGL